MLKKDYLIRQIHELIRALFELLLQIKENPEKKDNHKVLEQTYRFLNLSKDDFKNYTSEQLIYLFKDDVFALEKTELTGFLLFGEYKLNVHPDNAYLLQLSKDILKYVDNTGNTYSLERQMILDQITE